jgi:hypothetical protein
VGPWPEGLGAEGSLEGSVEGRIGDLVLVLDKIGIIKVISENIKI